MLDQPNNSVCEVDQITRGGGIMPRDKWCFHVAIKMPQSKFKPVISKHVGFKCYLGKAVCLISLKSILLSPSSSSSSSSSFSGMEKGLTGTLLCWDTEHQAVCFFNIRGKKHSAVIDKNSSRTSLTMPIALLRWDPDLDFDK